MQKMPVDKTDKIESPDKANEVKQANTCIGAGIGLAALSAGGAALTGAVCPLCYVVAPALVIGGAIGRYRAKKGEKSPNEDS